MIARATDFGNLDKILQLRNFYFSSLTVATENTRVNNVLVIHAGDIALGYVFEAMEGSMRVLVTRHSMLTLKIV
jgi:hypothetical protein